MTSEDEIGLSRRFASLSSYADSTPKYELLPFRFIELEPNRERYVLTNLVGEYVVATRPDLVRLIDMQLLPSEPLYHELSAKQIITEGSAKAPIELLSLKERTRFSRLPNFTSLHIFVVTLRCDYSCPYCQVSRQTEDRDKYDMTESIAIKCLDFVFRSPSPSIKIEFQGGEPLLNFELIKFIVIRAEERNSTEARDLEFVITTNLSFLSDEILDFCLEHAIFISTSLDGPEDIHNRNRPRPGKNGYELTVAAIGRAQRVLGKQRVSALMTTTESSLDRVTDIVDEYVSHGFNGIFLRPLSPYGFAIKTRQYDRYTTKKWLAFYRKGLDYIVDLNRRGTPIREFYASLLLRKLLTPHVPGYVDLQSPAGVGIAALVYNYDGDVYPSDEARMLVEMGDKTFRMGNVLTDSYEDVLTSDSLLDALESTYIDSVPICDRCAFNPVCGSDPVFHHATQGDMVGNKAISAFCERNMAVCRELIRRMEDDPYSKSLFESWAW